VVGSIAEAASKSAMRKLRTRVRRSQVTEPRLASVAAANPAGAQPWAGSDPTGRTQRAERVVVGGGAVAAGDDGDLRTAEGQLDELLEHRLGVIRFLRQLSAERVVGDRADEQRQDADRDDEQDGRGDQSLDQGEAAAPAAGSLGSRAHGQYLQFHS
jgi:hypothetical protein